MLAVSQPHWACPTHSTCALPAHPAQVHWELSEASPGLHASPRSKPLRFRHSGSPQRRRLGWACVLCPSQVRVVQEFGESCRFDLSPFLSLLLRFLGVQLAPLLRQMVTAQNPRKSWLAKKLACSLVVNVSRGCDCPLPALLALAACHWRGMVCSRLILFCPLFCAGGVLC